MNRISSFFTIASFIYGLSFIGNAMADNKVTINAGYTKIDHPTAHALIGTGKVVLVDVREKEEFETGFIPGAKLLPLGSISKETATNVIGDDLSKPVIVYCRSGRRSKTAADKLISLGYYYVLDAGGITTWPYERAYPDK